MIKKYSTEELNDIFDRLPEEIKDAIVSVDNARMISALGKKYNLHIDKVGEIAEETGLVLLGLTHPTEFVSNLTKRLGIDRIIASQIASDINDQVFLKVRELLKDIQKETAKKEEEEELEPRPSRDALLAALEHPEGMLKRPIGETTSSKTSIPIVEIRNPYLGRTPEMGKDFPVIAPAPSYIKEPTPTKTPETPVVDEKPSIQAPATDILTQKMSGQFSTPSTESTRKIDPYKEQI